MVWTHFTIVEAAGGVVLNEKEEILLIERKGWWDLPKGKMDAGETHEQTAIREVKEETGLHSISITKPLENTCHTYNTEDERFLKVCYWYEMKGSSLEKLIPQTEEQITQIIWVAKTDLKNYFATTYPAIVALLKSY
jgi:8-oxo-dGTP pyrophosphatase MutT (NUDIX family)